MKAQTGERNPALEAELVPLGTAARQADRRLDRLRAAGQPVPDWVLGGGTAHMALRLEAGCLSVREMHDRLDPHRRLLPPELDPGRRPFQDGDILTRLVAWSEGGDTADHAHKRYSVDQQSHDAVQHGCLRCPSAAAMPEPVLRPLIQSP
jgi:hypothetical protein